MLPTDQPHTHENVLVVDFAHPARELAFGFAGRLLVRLPVPAAALSGAISPSRSMRKGFLDGNRTISSRFPPTASMVLRSVDRYLSVCLSILETEGSLTLRADAMSVCALPASVSKARPYDRA
jgi:hypothetical protein